MIDGTDHEAFLLRRIAAGDNEAAENLAHAYAEKAFLVALRITGNEFDAQDAAQEALVTAINQAGSYSGIGPGAAWIHRIITNQARMLVRGETRRRKHEALYARLPIHGEPSSAEPRLDPAALYQAIKQLPESQRRVLCMHHLEGLSFSVIAAQTGQREPTVRKQASRGIQKLRMVLADAAAHGDAAALADVAAVIAGAVIARLKAAQECAIAG